MIICLHRATFLEKAYYDHLGSCEGVQKLLRGVQNDTCNKLKVEIVKDI